MKKVILVLSLIFLLASGCVRDNEGTINYSDCRVNIQTSSNSWDAETHSYVCEYDKAAVDGTITGSVCTRVKLDSQGRCDTSWTYTTGNLSSNNQ